MLQDDLASDDLGDQSLGLSLEDATLSGRCGGHDPLDHLELPEDLAQGSLDGHGLLHQLLLVLDDLANALESLGRSDLLDNQTTANGGQPLVDADRLQRRPELYGLALEDAALDLQTLDLSEDLGLLGGREGPEEFPEVEDALLEDQLLLLDDTQLLGHSTRGGDDGLASQLEGLHGLLEETHLLLGALDRLLEHLRSLHDGWRQDGLAVHAFSLEDGLQLGETAQSAGELDLDVVALLVDLDGYCSLDQQRLLDSLLEETAEDLRLLLGLLDDLLEEDCLLLERG